MKKDVSGITLVALVITVIILLILAIVAIGLVSGSGLFDKAELSKQEMEKAQNNEKTELSGYMNYMDQFTQPGNPPTKITADMVSFNTTHNDWSVNTVQEALDYLYGN